MACSRDSLFVVKTNGSHMCWGSMQRRKEYSYKGVGYRTELDLGRLCGADVLCDICLSFVSMRVLQKGEDVRGREWARVEIDRKIGGRLDWVIYTPISNAS